MQVQLVALLASAILVVPLDAQALVRDIRAGIGSSIPEHFVSLSGFLYFTANDGVNGVELWRSDGTASGTVMVKDINATAPGASSSPSGLTVFADSLVFSANDGVNGVELWRSDGTPAGTTMVRDIDPGPSHGSPYGFFPHGGALYFTATQALSGFELWRTDGTGPGTIQVADINPGMPGSTPQRFGALGSVLLFSAWHETFGEELWRSDGTTLGTTLVREIRPGRFVANIGELTRVGSVVVFRADDGVRGEEVWRTDGTAAGTFVLRDIYPGARGSVPVAMTLLGTECLFWADDGTHGRELWRTDGTAAGTALVRDISPTDAVSSFQPIFNVAGLAIFGAYGGPALGFEPWRSDTTNAGTALIKDINVGPNNAHSLALPSRFDPIGLGRLALFLATEPPSVGYEWYRTDGTTAGTYRVTNLAAGAASPSPFGTLVGSTIFFVASTPQHGLELWSMPAALVGAALADAYGVGCAGSAGVPLLGAQNAPVLGNASFALRCALARPNAPAAFLIAGATANLPIGVCTLLVDPAFVSILTASDAGGVVSLPLPVPNNTVFAGALLFAQCAVVDPNGSLFGAISLSHGLRIQIGR